MRKELLIMTMMAVTVAGSSCVAKKKYIEAENTIAGLRKENADLKDDVNNMKERLYMMEDANNMAANELTSKDSLLYLRENALKSQEQQLIALQAIIDKQKKQTQDLHQKMLNALGG